jgi:predicted ATPase
VAEPDTVVVSTDTQRLIEGFFICQALNSRTFKGLSQSMTVYQVRQESGVQSRLEVAVGRGLTPLVGREQEVGLLLERWEQAKEGIGQVVMLSGEAGIGKSRLVQELKERVAGGPHTRLEFHCSSYYQNSALYPVIEHLQRLLQFRREDSPEQKLNKLEEALERYKFSLPDVVPLFAALLSLPLPERYTPLTLTPQRQKQKTLEALVAWLRREAERQSVLLIVEDLHWVDPSTLEFLSFLVDQRPRAHMLMLLTFRPEFILPWDTRSPVIQLTLNRLASKQVEAIVASVAGSKTLPAEVVQQVVRKRMGYHCLWKS